jgi:hypothetical protein
MPVAFYLRWGDERAMNCVVASPSSRRRPASQRHREPRQAEELQRATSEIDVREPRAAALGAEANGDEAITFGWARCFGCGLVRARAQQKVAQPGR